MGHPLYWVLIWSALWLWLPLPSLAQSTVSVWVPGYDEDEWEALRGSVIGTDSDKTTYTIFCAEGNQAAPTLPACELQGTLPFTFTEGAEILQYAATKTGELTVRFGCELDGTTAAVCSGFSALAEGLVQGNRTGPTSYSWTNTYSSPDVTWAPLTLTDAPGAANGPITNAAMTTINGIVQTASPDGAAASTETRLGLVYAAAGFAMLGMLF